MLDLVRLAEGVDQRVGEVAPLIVEADVGKIHEGADAQSDPKTTALPGERTQVSTRNLESVKMLERERERKVLTINFCSKVKLEMPMHAFIVLILFVITSKLYFDSKKCLPLQRHCRTAQHRAPYHPGTSVYHHRQ